MMSFQLKFRLCLAEQLPQRERWSRMVTRPKLTPMRGA